MCMLGPTSPCFFDGSGGIRCLASDAPEIRKLEFSDFRKSGFSEIWKSGNLKIWIFRFPKIRISGNRTSENPENPKIRIFGYSDFPDFRKIGKSKKSGKKASDVEFAYVEFPLKSTVMKPGERVVLTSLPTCSP